MKILLALLCVALSAAPAFAQGGALTAKGTGLEVELLISDMPTADLRTQIMSSSGGTIEHKSEVARSAPVAAVVRTAGCTKGTDGRCHVNADVVVYKPDGSVHHEAKNLDLPEGRAAVPLTFDEKAAVGVYRAVATVRDLTSRRFATVERKFGIKEGGSAR